MRQRQPRQGRQQFASSGLATIRIVLPEDSLNHDSDLIATTRHNGESVEGILKISTTTETVHGICVTLSGSSNTSPEYFVGPA